MPAKSTTKASATPAALVTPYRRNIANLWLLAHQQPSPLRTDQANTAKEDLDRYMIALYRLQTEGRVYMNFVAGIHNGGWYDPAIEKAGIDKLMFDSALGDRNQLYYGATTPDHGGESKQWPDMANTQPTNVVPDLSGNAPNPPPVLNYVPVNGTDPNTWASLPNWWRSHQFCWHAKSPFFVWHRPYMALFEKLLQHYDVADASVKAARPIGMHYFAWEDWDGTSIPVAFTVPDYVVKSDLYKARYLNAAAVDGSVTVQFPNPLLRWFGPRSFADQYAGNFPSLPLGGTAPSSSVRDPAHSNPNADVDFPWRNGDDDKVDPLNAPNLNPADKDATKGKMAYSVPRRSIKHVISDAMSEPHWCFVATVEFSANAAMEEPHNRFHNRIGGREGTMTSNQSPYDPIFWVHHSNIERQLVSWQTIHSNPTAAAIPAMSRPPPALADFCLYPFAKPSIVKAALSTARDPIAIIKAFISAKPSETGPKSTTGTIAEWFDAWTDDQGAFEALHEKAVSIDGPSGDSTTVGVPRRLTANCSVFDTKQLKPGTSEYTLKYTDNASKVQYFTTISFTSLAASGACLRCDIKVNSRNGYSLPFDITLIPPLQQLALDKKVGSTVSTTAFPPPITASGVFELFDVDGKAMTVGANGATKTSDMVIFYARSLPICGHAAATPPPKYTAAAASSAKTGVLGSKRPRPVVASGAAPTLFDFDDASHANALKTVIADAVGAPAVPTGAQKLSAAKTAVGSVGILDAYKSQLGGLITKFATGEISLDDTVFVNTTVDSPTGEPWMVSRFTGDFSKRFHSVVEGSKGLKAHLTGKKKARDDGEATAPVSVVYIDVAALKSHAAAV